MGCGSSRAAGAVSPSAVGKKGGIDPGIKFGKDARLKASFDSANSDESYGAGAVSFVRRDHGSDDGEFGVLQVLRPEARGPDVAANSARARALAERVLPFLPVRVVRAFAEGFLNGSATGSVVPAPEPRVTHAAVLVLDVSGFTKLSEKYSRMGSKGAEAFTLNISTMFARMTSVIRTFHGDVDCFAGDAVLVLFEAADGSGRKSNVGCDDIRCATQRAVNCAKEVHQQINGFQVREDDPPLTIHCALAAGRLYCIECGGSTTSRSEAFVLGPPMKELEGALSQSKTGELLIASSARELLGDAVRGEVRDQGCLCVVMTQHIGRGLSEERVRAPQSASVGDMFAAASSRPSQVVGDSFATAPSQPSPAVSDSFATASSRPSPAMGDTFATALSQPSSAVGDSFATASSRPNPADSDFSAMAPPRLSMGNNGLQTVPEEALSRFKALSTRRLDAEVARSSEDVHTDRLLEEVVAQMHSVLDVKLRSSQLGDADPLMNSSRMRSSTRSSIERNLRRSIDNNAVTQGMLQGYNDDSTDITHGLESMLNFTPRFVQTACKAGHDLDMLAEHRTVTVLFMIGSLDQYVTEDVQFSELLDLQRILGEAIDAAEGQLGGATRQITVDDKGLAMIFVFGLPGFFYHNHTVRCLMAAQKVLGIMRKSQLNVTAGITTGACFCGLIGDLKTRCEYAVMGDVVNTGARLAVQAAKLGVDHLCTHEVCTAMEEQLEVGHSLSMKLVAHVKLKGKEGETAVYTSQGEMGRKSFSNTARTPPKHELVGRDAELAQLVDILQGRGADIRIAVLDGIAGVGKSAVLHTALFRVKLDKRPTLQIHCSYEDQTPFITCQNILRWMLELEGHEDAVDFAWLMDDTMMTRSPEELPAMIRPYAAQIVELFRLPPQLKMTQLQMIYAQIMLNTLRKTPVVILLEDIQLMDEGSANVLGNISVGAMDFHGADGPACRYYKSKTRQDSCKEIAPLGERPSVLMCTSRSDVICDVTLPGAALECSIPLHELPGVHHCKLSPLPDEDILDVARTLLKAKSLSPDLEQLVKEQSQGVPLYTHELCLWLSNQGMVQRDPVSNTVYKKHTSTTVPPSLQRVIQAQIDQLPQGLVVVLRYASVLGKQFSSAMLAQMLPARIAASVEVLEEQLRMLQFLHIIVPMPRAVFSVGDSWWQFEQQLHQEVVYTSLTHGHKKSLHRHATRMIMGLLAKMQANQRAGAGQEVWNLLQALAKHSVEVVKTGASEVTYADLETCSNALMHAAEYLTAIGDFKGAWTFKANQLQVLHGSNKLCHSVSRLDLELNAVRHAVQMLMAALANGTGQVIKAAERLTELRKLEALLLKALGRSDEADMVSFASIDDILGASEQQITAFPDASVRGARLSAAGAAHSFGASSTALSKPRPSYLALLPHYQSSSAAAAENYRPLASGKYPAGAFASADAAVGPMLVSAIAAADADTEAEGSPKPQQRRSRRVSSASFSFAAATMQSPEGSARGMKAASSSGFRLPDPAVEEPAAR